MITSPLATLVDAGGGGDPYPLYAELRETRPICFDDEYGVFVCTRHETVLSVLTDPRFSSQRFAESDLWDPGRLPEEVRETATSVYGVLGRRLLMQDPPEHTRMRRTVGAGFGRKAVTLLKPRIEAIVDSLLDEVVPSGHMEVVTDLAGALPVRVIAELLGVSVATWPSIERWAEAFSASRDVDPRRPERETRAVLAIAELLDFLADLVDERRSGQRREDVLQLLVDAVDLDEAGEAELLVANLAGLLVGGHDTTRSLISTGVLSLIEHPGEQQRLREDPSLLPSAVEELLRYETPVQWLVRRATTELVLGSERVRSGQLVGVFLGAANRDPEVFADPDRLDLGRSPNPHLTFAHGRHFCIGAPLARLEASIAISRLLTHCGGLELVGDGPTWSPSFSFRGLKHLEVGFSPVPAPAG